MVNMNKLNVIKICVIILSPSQVANVCIDSISCVDNQNDFTILQIRSVKASYGN